MSDLFTMLGVTARALDAQRYGLDVTGQNIANINTAGYTRRTVQMAALPPTDNWSAGEGVQVTGVVASRAPLIDARLRSEQATFANDSAVADHLAGIEATIGLPGASLDSMLTQFYNTYAALAQNPTSVTARQQVVIEGQSLASAFGAMADGLDGARQSADAELRDAVSQVNALARQLADLNSAIPGATGAAAETLKDQQSVVLDSLSALAGVHTIVNSNGTIDVTIGNGRALVAGDRTYPVDVQPQPPDGMAALTTNGGSTTIDLSAEITTGRIGGLLTARDQLVPGYISQLDSLAYNVATDVNTLARSGYDAAGNAGVDLFTQPASATGAAHLMAVNSAVVADPSLVVAAGTPTAGDNSVARSIAALQDHAMTGSAQRPADAWGGLVFRVGADSKSATQSRDAHDQLMQQLTNMRDQVSGVSLDEETATMMRFQRAYEANARFFQVADATLDVLMSLARS